MTIKKKIIIAISSVILISFLGRRIVFAVKCIIAESNLKEHFSDNSEVFSQLSNISKSNVPYNFQLYSKDSVSINFSDSSFNYESFFPDTTFNFSNTSKINFLVDKNYCLNVIKGDTLKICTSTWFVSYYGHYKSSNLDNLLRYYGIKRDDFNTLVDIMQSTQCESISATKDMYRLDYKFVSYYGSGLTNCFGHSDGFFNYVQTENPDSIYYKEHLTKYTNDFYGYSFWTFIW